MGILGLTGSGIARALKCVGPMVLPHVRRTNQDAAWGTALHAFLHDVRVVGLDRALERAAPEHREAFAALDFDKLPLDPQAYAGEVAFAYDVEHDTARELGRGDRKSTRLNSSHCALSRMPSSA